MPAFARQGALSANARSEMNRFGSICDALSAHGRLLVDAIMGAGDMGDGDSGQSARLTEWDDGGGRQSALGACWDTRH